MSTEKQNEANRRNAQLSTGPRTTDGKTASSLNALKHGLTATQILIPSENADDFESHAASFRDRWAPVDSVESFLVDQMIVAAWRLRRTRFLETSVYAQRAFEVARNQREREEELTDPADHIVTGYRRECSGTNSLENISRQETRIERAFYRAMLELNRLRGSGGRKTSSVRPAPPILQNEPNSRPPDCGQDLDEGPPMPQAPTDLCVRTSNPLVRSHYESDLPLPALSYVGRRSRYAIAKNHRGVLRTLRRRPQG